MAFTASRISLHPHLSGVGAVVQETLKQCRSSQTSLRLAVPFVNHQRTGDHRATPCSVFSPKPSRSTRQVKRLEVTAAKQDGATSTVVAQEVSFEWKGSAKEVFLTGSFLNWDAKVELQKLSNGFFATKQRLGPGTYTFKYIVDGTWVHSPDAPTIDDGNGGFNNELVVTAEDTSAPPPPPKEAAPKPKPAAPAAKAAAAPAPAPKAAAAPAAKPAAKPAPKGKKAAAKPLKETMIEDVIPALRASLEAVDGVTDVILEFEDNQLTGTLTKDGVPISFWAYFPDGKLEGARGFSLTAHGYEPSTVEPFLIDEKRITPDLVVFWVTKRLDAQKMLALN